MERLTEELGKLQGDLERQEALVSQRDGVIEKLMDEARLPPGSLPSSTGLLELSQT